MPLVRSTALAVGVLACLMGGRAQSLRQERTLVAHDFESSAHGWLDTDGHLTLHVKGLVFTDDPEVPPNLRGTNDEPTFRVRAASPSSNQTPGLVIELTAVATPAWSIFSTAPAGDQFWIRDAEEPPMSLAIRSTFSFR